MIRCVLKGSASLISKYLMSIILENNTIVQVHMSREVIKV